jgi:hypothetical protein
MQEHLRDVFGSQADELPNVKVAKRKAFTLERAAAIREGTRDAYEQCVTDADNGAGFAEHLTKHGLTLERDQWQTLYVSDGKRQTPLEKLIDAGEQRDHLSALGETGIFAQIDYYEAKRRYWSVAEREEMQANKQRAEIVADAVLEMKDIDMLTDMQRQYRVVFSQDEKGLLHAVTDRASIAMNREQSRHVRELMGQPEAMPTLQGARHMAYWLEQEHGIRETVTQGLEQSISAQDGGQAFLETLGKNYLELHRDYGERLYVSDGKRRLQLDNIVTTEQQAKTLDLIAEQDLEIQLFRSTLDRQEGFEQRILEIETARLERMITRDVNKALDLVAAPVMFAIDMIDPVGEAAGMVASVAGRFIAGFARLTDNAMDFFTDFFTGGSVPATRIPVQQREALPPAAKDKTPIERAREHIRSLTPDIPALDPQTEAVHGTFSQHYDPDLARHIEELKRSRGSRSRDDESGRDRGMER